MNNGKPEMSRELIERIIASQQQSADDCAATGLTRVEGFQARRQRDMGSSRRMVGQYNRSFLGRSAGRRLDANVNKSQNHNFSAVNSQSEFNHEKQHIDTGVNRPSSGYKESPFKEIPGRGYDPYG